MTGGTADGLPAVAAELTGSFPCKIDAGAPPPPRPASACVAVEDSPDGTASAHAAGCAVLVVPSLLPVDPARGRTFARSLEEVDLGVLSDCLRRPEASGS